MDFKGNYRVEAVYFEKLKRNINEAKRLLESGATEEARFLLEDSVDVDGSVLLLYRNLGELWAELADKLEETKKSLQALDEKTEKYHDELNEKIDEVNNYIMSLIRALEERVTDLETTVADHETRIGNLEDCCEDVQEALANKQDKLTAGEGITIDNNNVISAPKELYPIVLTLDPVTREPSIDKTYQQIKAAYESGKLPIMYNLYTEEDPDEPYYEYKLFYFDSDETYDGMTFYAVKNDYLLSGVSGDPLSMFTKALKEIVIIESDDTITRTESRTPITSSRTTVSTEEAGNTITLKTKFSDIRTAFFGVGVLIKTGPITNYIQQEVIEMGFDETNHVYYAKTLDKTYVTNDPINGYAVYTRT